VLEIDLVKRNLLSWATELALCTRRVMLSQTDKSSRERYKYRLFLNGETHTLIIKIERDTVQIY